MKASVKFLALALLGIIVLLSPAYAGLTMHSDVDCTGDCTVKQSYNGDSVEVTTSGKVSMTTKGDGEKAEVSVEAEGEGEAKITKSDGTSSTVKIGSSSGSSGSTKTSGAATIASEAVTNASSSTSTVGSAANEALCNGTDTTCGENSTEENSESWMWETNAATIIYSGDANGSSPETSGQGQEENLNAGTGKTIVEANADGSEERLEEDGPFQKIYQFFEQLTLKIWFF
ncbi:MAG: hypothetical protein JW727_00190 [Candidatus Aenigmarchaeota archaeon]|nr:hypothetical protein [Candidatus Aenigmarchaeota archaeon]